MSRPNSIIRPEIAAQKMAALKNLQSPQFAAALAKEPRLTELHWAIQSWSLQAGGLEKFTADFLALFSDSIGTAAMRRIAKTDVAYTASERNEVIDSFPDYSYQGLSAFSFPTTENEINADRILSEFQNQMLGKMDYGLSAQSRPDLAFVTRQNFPYFSDFCNRVAVAVLPVILSSFCTTPDAVIPDVWWFHDLPGALIEMLDAHAGRASQEIVMTEVASQVIDALDFAWQEKAMIEIIGDSRFGKTESVKAYCAMYPGRARLVKTPCDNADRSLMEAIAEAMGIELSLKLTSRELKTKVEFVLKHSGLMFVFDEAAWLIPQRYSPKTAPMRLNYIRSQILENGCPVALIQTPQFFGPAAQKFERTTGFNMTQWKGRIMRTVQLPGELPEHDLAAIVKHHFPEIEESCVSRVVGCALASESYLFAVLKIAKNARAVARKSGRSNVTLDDLNAGIALAGIVLPQQTQSAPPVTTSPRGLQSPIAAKRGRPKKISASMTTPGFQAPARETTLEIQPA